MINHIEIEGNLTREPETKPVAGGKTVISFGIAQTPQKKDESGNWGDGDTSYYDVEFWPSNPQFWLQRLTKGTSVIVFGSLKQDRWEQDGQARSKHKIIAKDVTAKWIPEITWQEQMKGKPAQTQQQQPQQPAQQQYAQQPAQNNGGYQGGAQTPQRPQQPVDNSFPGFF